MPDRHWMEKWKWEHTLEGEAKPRLVRKSDGKQAEGWKHAAKIEGAERGVSSTEMLTNPAYAMVPLKELYPDKVEVPERIGSGAERVHEPLEPEDVPFSGRPERAGESSTLVLMFIGWILTIIAA